MATWAFASTEFSQVLNHELAEALVGTSITTTQFLNGNSVKGDQIKVLRPTAISVVDYDPNVDITFTRDSGSISTLTIEKDKAFGRLLDDFDAHASQADLAAGIMREAKRALANAADTYILSASCAGALAGNVITVTPIISGSTAPDLLAGYVRQASVRLSEQDVPFEDRILVLPPAGVQYLNNYLVNRDTALGDEMVQKGYMGMFEGFQVYLSNQLPTGRVLYGTRQAATFATAINEFDVFRHPLRFAWAFKGRHTYGLKVFGAEQMGRLEATIQYA